MQRNDITRRMLQRDVPYRGKKERIGTRASATMIGDDETNWGTKSLAILDMPFTAVLDTILLPWDVFRKDSSVRSRVEKSEADAQETNNVIPRQNACKLRASGQFR